MNVKVSLNGAVPVIQRLNGAATKIHTGWKREAFAVGARAVTLMKARRRQLTEVRSGAALRSYDHAVKDIHNGILLTAGAIKPTEGGHVPLHVRVLEGYNAAGNKVTQFIIVPRNKPYLWFPIRRGAGLARSNIVRWVRTLRVVLKPTPVVDPVGRDIPGALRSACGKVFSDALAA